MSNDKRIVTIKDLTLGGGSSVAVQSMSNHSLLQTELLICQIQALAKKGAHLVRFSVRNHKEADNIRTVVDSTSLPLCADIHFDYTLALRAIESGISKIRINPGNIGSEKGVRAVVDAAKQHGIAIRVGVNGGSVDRSRYTGAEEAVLVESALDHVRILERYGFYNTVISIKSSDVLTTIAANRLLAAKSSYPVHIGLTEAGYGYKAFIKSSIALGALLMEDIGDTIRVSITGDPLQEIDVAYEILRSVKKIDYGINIVSCPTCGRTDTQIDLEKLAQSIDSSVTETYLSEFREKRKIITIAVMGCEVNGPGEAAGADIGVAGCGRGRFALFNKGVICKKLDQDEVIDAILGMVKEYLSR